jgi:hypothetical protein
MGRNFGDEVVFPLMALQLSAIFFVESGEATPLRGQVLQGGFYDNFNEKSGFPSERHNCGWNVW